MERFTREIVGAIATNMTLLGNDVALRRGLSEYGCTVHFFGFEISYAVSLAKQSLLEDGTDRTGSCAWYTSEAANSVYIRSFLFVY